MALRVLLADESVTIKKVIQLALQDFAVEVKAVPVGVDVLDVTKSFKPDLIFADILLQKRSGYDVCRDLKRDSETASLPVVLMWSSFMELDQAQLEATGADGKLEKPFDVETLRRLVLELVPRTRTQRMAHYLDFPATVAAPLKSEEAERAKTYQPPVPAGDFEVAAPPPTGFTPAIPERPEAISLAPSEPEPMVQERRHEPAPPTKEEPLGALPDLHFSGASGWNMESFEPLSSFDDLEKTDDEADEFKPIQLPSMDSPFEAPTATPSLSLLSDDNEDDEKWAPQSLDKYRIAPLSTEEALALDDDETPAIPTPTPATAARSTAVTDKISVQEPPSAPRTIEPTDDDELAEFSLDEEDFDKTLEIEPISHEDRTQPSIVRELLREPDFTGNRSTDRARVEASTASRREAPTEEFDPSDITHKIPETGTFFKDAHGAVDLSKAGRPSPNGRELYTPPEPSYRSSSTRNPIDINERNFEDAIRAKMEPALEAVIERMVNQLLPQIAERIISRELQKLLEDSEK